MQLSRARHEPVPVQHRGVGPRRAVAPRVILDL
jgi:hypothetical protein